MNSAISEGVTPSERYLSRLCRKSFLSLWSYPNLRTDAGKRHGKGVGNELCDLLVVFGNDVVIFSDKYIKFNEAIDINIAWARWFKRAVQASVRQINGAEAWIRNHRDRIYLDPQCNVKFPIPIPNGDDLSVHRVAVASGVFQSCRSYFGGNSIGSLIVNSALQGDVHYAYPFHVGHVNPTKGFVHVFEEFTLDAVLREMDTAADFITYLLKREQFLTRDKPLIMASGDEQLLSIYLTKTNEQGEHDFVIPGEGEPDCIYFDESFWDSMISNPQYLAKKKADEVSYAWDRLIEHFIQNAAVIEKPSSIITNETQELEQGLRIMASEPRIRRRLLARALIDLAKNSLGEHRSTRLVYSNDFPERAYIFLLLPFKEEMDYEEYRRGRKALLAAYCRVAKLVCIKAGIITGIAMETPNAKKSSEDMVVLDVHDWTDEMEHEAKHLQQEAGLLLIKNMKMTADIVKEYPEVRPIREHTDEEGLNRKQRRAIASRERRARRKRK
ncbi:MAG: hypothetical protein PHN75_04485 [Syntrophales bacterium]|nr:hypothetical protein [Syntrophales bacterium]